MARRAASAAFVGREGELATLADLAAKARRGRPGLAVVAGAAGVGKSRLVREAERAAAQHGMLVLHGECLQLGGQDVPYAPVSNALRGLPEELEAAALAGLAPDALAELALLLPRAPARADRGDGGPGRFAQSRLHELLLGLLAGVAEQAGGIVLVVDDLHWADRPTLELLSFVRGWARAEPVLLVVTYRTDELRGDHPLRLLLGELVRDDRVELLSLDPLGRAEVLTQIEAILGRPPDPALADDVVRRAEGNPFHVEQLVAAHRSGRAELAHGLRDALLLRVEGLSPTAADALRALAVLERPAPQDLLAEVAGIGEPALSRALREAVTAHLVTHDRETGTLRFAQGLLREAVVADLLPGERTATHAAAAHALQRAGAEPAELAFHWEAAGEPGPALECAVAAGLAAARVYAFTDARRHLERALRLWDQVAPDRVGGLDRGGVLAAAAEAARSAGDYAAAVAHAEVALALVDPHREPDRAARLHERLGQYRFWDDAAALAEYARALDLLPEDRRVERARLHAAEAHALSGMARFADARDQASKALALAQAAGAEAEEGLARTTLGLALAFLGEHDAGEEHARTALAIAERQGQAEALSRAHLHLSEVLRVRGDLEGALTVTDAGEATARAMGMGGSFGRFLHVNGTEDLLRLGRWAEVAERLDEQARGVELGPTGELMHHTIAAQLHAARGDERRAREHLRRAHELAADGMPTEFLPGIHAAGAELDLWQHRAAEAAAELEGALAAIGEDEDPLNTPVLFALAARAYADAAEQARAFGDEAAVERADAAVVALAARLDRLVARHAASAAPPEPVRQRAWMGAELARLRGTATAADWARVPAGADPYAQAYRHWRRAEALVREGDRPAAAAALRDAAALADPLGAAPLRAAVEDLARRARLDLVAPADGDAPAADAGPGAALGLTPREAEVLALVADGLTNRQIAERLFISVRTAGVHVSNILAKLNAANRVEAAGVAHRLGLLDGGVPTP
jgi:DNA-binding CsgD family transcriptional regulator